MSFFVSCPAVATDPEQTAATQAALVGVLATHMNTHPGFSWPDWYINDQNCHSAPWRVKCPANPNEPMIEGVTRADLVTKIAQHLAAVHPAFSWINWYVTKNCHSSPAPVAPGR